MPEFYGADGFPQGIYLFLDLLDKGFPSLFFQDIQGVFYIGKFLINCVKRRKDVFK